MRHRLAALALLLIGGSALAQTKIEPRFNVYDDKQDIELGRQAAAEAMKKMPLITDQSVVRYLEQIGGRLVAKSRGPDFPYEFHVVNSSDINAFALPGGPVFVNRGIFEYARNDGEVAGVVAHEIAHVVLRHGTSNMSKATVTQQGFGILGGLLGSMAGKAGGLVQQASGMGAALVLLRNSREAETDADIYGAQILARAGFNPQDMIGFFETLDAVTKSSGSRTANWLSDHPTPDRRVERIAEEAALLKVKPAKTISTTGLAPVQTALKGIPAPKGTVKPGEGSAAPTANRPPTAAPVALPAPASQTRTYTARSAGHRITYPANWEVHEGEKSGVVLAPPGGLQQTGRGTAISCGAILNRYASLGNDTVPDKDDDKARAPVEKAFGDMKAQILQSHPYLKKIQGSSAQYRAPDGSSKGAVLQGSPGGGAPDESVTLYMKQAKDGSVFFLLFVTPAAEAARQEPALRAILSSISAT